MGFQGRFYKFIRGVVRLLRKYRYHTPDRSVFTEPAVYVCRHSDNDGPIITMVNLPLPLHPWSYHVWCDEIECYKQCVDYTFTVRYGWSQQKAKFVASLISKPFAALIRSAGSIAVYRNSLKVRETFKESVEALKRGESLLIFPDVEYDSKEGNTGALYEGFLMLERLYFKETEKHLPFVPIRIKKQTRTLEIDEAISFRDGIPFKDDKERVIRELHIALNDAEASAAT
ncbi:MAG: glycerol acyltransferase [Clostridia bacterium]|nr:glycerol acyltransferase [Clostridia bacterium]